MTERSSNASATPPTSTNGASTNGVPRTTEGWHAFPEGADAAQVLATSTSLRTSWRADLPASIVVVLVALPLCLGIALASGAPLVAGLISGIVGGIVVGALSNSQLMVSGPAAGLTAIVVTGIASMGSYRAFLTCVVIGGALQLLLSILRAGIVGYYFPSAVIKGMLAAIGVILILKQLPHAFGYDADYEGDESFAQGNSETTFSALGEMVQQIQLGPTIVAALALLLLVMWERPSFRAVRRLPAPLVVVLVAIALNAGFAAFAPSLAIESSHLVNLPVVESASGYLAFFALPDFSVGQPGHLHGGADHRDRRQSLETLLNLEAIDKLDLEHRVSDPPIAS